MTSVKKMPLPDSTQEKYLILVVEDEMEIFEILSSYLYRSGLRTVHAADGQQALTLHLKLKPDLVLLDIQIPYIDGWKVLAEILNRGNTPVIMLTAMDQDIDKLMGLRMGADDYVVKPFNPAEVVARTLAVLRRSSASISPAERRILRVAPFYIDLDSYEVMVEKDNLQKPLVLTLTEFKLLVHMARTPKRVFSREELLANCLPESDALARTVDSHISKLRKKIEDLGINGIPSVVRGVGYCLWRLE